MGAPPALRWASTPDPFDPRHVTGLILAGGAGSRMDNADKGLVPLAGRPLVEHVVQRLRGQCASLIVSANRNQDHYRRYTPRIVSDARWTGVAPSYDGPLAGLLAGLRTARAMHSHWVLCTPCDTPFLPLDLAARLHAGIGIAPIAVATSSDNDEGGDAPRVHPLCALLRGSALAELTEDLANYLAEGGRRVMSWQQRHNAVAVPFDERLAFYNANDRAALDRAAHRLASSGAGCN